MLEVTSLQAAEKTRRQLLHRFPSLQFPDPSLLRLEDLIMNEHQQTEHALRQLGIKDVLSIRPGDVQGVGTLHRCGRSHPPLPIVEILGMPDAGKSTHIAQLIADRSGDAILQIPEGASRIKNMVSDLMHDDPFAYTQVVDLSAAFLLTDALTDTPDGTELILPERGLSERIVWRRTHFAMGNVNPGFMELPGYGPVETHPSEPTAIILLMCRPEVGQARKSQRNNSVSQDLLQELYRQYWRLHYDLMYGTLKTPYYMCIDAEQNIADVYQQFREVFDLLLN